MAQNGDTTLESLLDYLRQSRGFDFGAYKRPSLVRRIAKRMQAVSVASFGDYIDYLEVHPEEFSSLFNTILINVTAFFRDPESWQCLKDKIIPLLLANKKGDVPIRAWSAGCSSGEEAYTMAILLCEALGKQEFRKRVKIYGTDVDEEALNLARQASYSEKEVQSVPEELRAKYFDINGGHYVFNTDLRRCVIFGRHDLIQDAPMSRLDLLVCRNTLMYFNAETQARILGRFNYALNPNGFLFLGKAELLLVHSTLFTAVEIKHRIFAKFAQVSLRDRLLVFAQNSAAGVEFNNQVSRHVRLRDAAFDTRETPEIIIDADSNLLLANQQARRAFDLDQNDIGRPFQDLEISYRPVELRSLIERAYAERQKVTAVPIERRSNNGDSRWLDAQVAPLIESDVLLGARITFDDVTGYHALEEEVQKARQDAETVNEELQAANEELQSTNEELETTNEELQSTNEELETMNEELQSANEELQTMNEEMRQRTDEINASAIFLNGVLSSLRGGVTVVDKELRIIVWNAIAEELWGVRFDEVKGKSLLSLDIGLPVSELRGPIRQSIADHGASQELILDAVNRRGRNFKCRVIINPFQAVKGVKEGAVIMMEEMGM